MARNGVLLNNAANVTGSGLKLRDIFEEGELPKDVIKVLIIDHDVFDKIITNDLVRGVTLTGSSGAGRYIAQKAAAVLKSLKKKVPYGVFSRNYIDFQKT